MEKEPTMISLRKDIKDRANKALDSGKFPGIASLSSLIEFALDAILKNSKQEA
jgi:hypothetical protein